MIEYIKKDITTVQRGVVAHGVNCQHTMASGVAKYIREKWPIVYDNYMLCGKGQDMLGECVVVEIDLSGALLDCELFVANCYTQVMYGYGGGKYASPEAIRASMVTVFQYADNFDLPVFLPRIGCARGGLSWHEDVYPILEELNSIFERVDVFVCDHQPSDENFKLNY